MADPLPNTGDSAWGTTLNEWLAQMGDPTNGGINTLASDPSMVGLETGFTFLHTGEGVIKRYNGTSWDIAGAAASGISEPATYTPAWMEGGTNLPSPELLWGSITDGSFRINLNGTDYNVDGIDFTGATTHSAAAAIIQTELRSATGDAGAVVEYDTDHFKITSGNTTINSSVSALTTSTGTVGTDISGVANVAGYNDYMDCDSATIHNTVLDQTQDAGKATLLNSSGKLDERFIDSTALATQYRAGTGSWTTSESTPKTIIHNLGSTPRLIEIDYFYVGGDYTAFSGKAILADTGSGIQLASAFTSDPTTGGGFPNIQPGISSIITVSATQSDPTWTAGIVALNSNTFTLTPSPATPPPAYFTFVWKVSS